MPARKNTTRPTPAPKALEKYAQKRDFGRTPEPGVSRGAGDGHQFVVQRHDARRLHYDLRLELDGVLKSWAVTRGPSLTLGEKRLAVRTEDHPVDYLDFEGNIPKGEYGGGSMIVWDRGRWLPQEDPHRGLQKGHLAFTLDGTRLQGLWHLVRIRPRKGEKTEPWLLMKAEDEFARHPGDPEITDEETTSYLSGRTNEELAAAGDIRADHAARTRVARARKRLLPDPGKDAGRPQEACCRRSSSRAWHRHAKSRRAGRSGFTRSSTTATGCRPASTAGAVRLFTRKALDWTERFASIAAAIGKVGFGIGPA